MKSSSSTLSTTTIPSSPVQRKPLDVLKILQCTNLGGMEQTAYDLLDGLSKTPENRFHVMTPRPFGPGKGRLARIDSKARDFVYRGKFGWRSFRSFHREVKILAEQVDTVWVTGTCACSLAAIRKLPNRKIFGHHFHHFQNKSSRFQWAGFYNLLCRNIDLITYPTDFTRNEAISIAPWLKSKSQVVRYGYPVYYTGEEDRIQLQQNARRSLNLPEDAFIIGNAGWLIARKRFDVFLHTAQRFAELNPLAFFVICGGGPLEGELKALAEKLGIADRVRFAGWISDLVPYYRAWDVCLFNSDFDALGRTPMEAASHGCLVVASVLYGGLREFYRTAEDGILLDKHDPKLLAEYIQGLAEFPAMSLEFREAAVEKLKREYSMEQSLEFYRQALGG